MGRKLGEGVDWRNVALLASVLLFRWSLEKKRLADGSEIRNEAEEDMQGQKKVTVWKELQSNQEEDGNHKKKQTDALLVQGGRQQLKTRTES